MLVSQVLMETFFLFYFAEKEKKRNPIDLTESSHAVLEPKAGSRRPVRRSE